MKPRPKFRAALLLAAIATAPAAALAAETYYYVPADGNYYSVPATREYYVIPVYSDPPITVYGQRATEDELITREVVDELSRDPRLSGYIGVETRNSEVTLSGRVTTPGQVDRAARDARRVDGVRNVNNYLRSRVGGG
jgi:hypothetical protein